MSQHDAIEQVFARIARCYSERDRAGFAALCSRPDTALLDLFEHNARKMQDRRWALRLRDIAQEGALALLRFDVVGETGDDIDQGEISLGLDGGGWRVLQL